jgi:hypothetical protein
VGISFFWGTKLTSAKYFVSINEEAGPAGTIGQVGAPRVIGGTVEFHY